MALFHGNLYLLWGSADTLAGALGCKDGSRKGLLQNHRTINGIILMSWGSKSWPFNLRGVFLCTSLTGHVGTVVLQLLSVFHVSFLTVRAQQPQLLRPADHPSSHSKILQRCPTGIWAGDRGSRGSAATKASFPDYAMHLGLLTTRNYIVQTEQTKAECPKH